MRVPDQLSGHDSLMRKGVMVMDDTTALLQDIRPLQIGLLNLIPAPPFLAPAEVSRIDDPGRLRGELRRSTGLFRFGGLLRRQ